MATQMLTREATPKIRSRAWKGSFMAWPAMTTTTTRPRKPGDHAGAIEPVVVERKDGTIWMLIRTTRGQFWQSTSSDGLS